jgi:hypothetical protein
VAVTIDATNLVLINAADSTTGWTSSMGGLTTASNLSREGGTNLADQASSESYEVYHTAISANYSDRTIFGWQKQETPTAEADATAAGMAMYLGDGTNNRVYDVGGFDNWAFFFNSWGGYRLNTAGLPTQFRQDGGGAPTLTGITRVGYGGRRPIKANGTANNFSCDVIRSCANANPALLIEGGTTGDRGTFAEIVALDESTNNAWMIMRTLIEGSKAYELNFGIQIGSLDSSAYFEDDGFQLFINGALTSGGTISAGSMDVDCVGHGASTNVCNFDNFYVQSIGAVSNWSMSADLDTANWTNGQFVDCGTFTFPAQDAGNKSLANITFVNCGQVTFEGIDADNIVFNGTTDANGAVYWDEGTVEENQDNLTFNSDGTGNAIEINPTGAGPFTYNIDGYIFDGYAGQTGTAANRVFFINPATLSADITINLTNCEALNIQGGGNGFSYREVASYTGTVTINNTVTLQVSVVDDANQPVPYASVSILNATTRAEISAGVANNLGVYTDSTYNYGGDVDVLVVVRKSSPGAPRYLPVESPQVIGSGGLTVGIGLNTAPFAGAIPMRGVLRHGVQSESVNDAVVSADIDLPAGTNRVLVIAGMYWGSASDLTVSSAQYDSNNMTSVNSISVGSFNEVFLYRHAIPDGDSGRKTVTFTFSAAVSIKALAFAILDDVTAAPESNDTDSGSAATGNPSLSLNNTTADSFSVGFLITDDLDSPAATGATENRVRRSDLARDGLAQSIAVLTADRSSSGAHTIGADYGANIKSWVAAGATFAKN